MIFIFHGDQMPIYFRDYILSGFSNVPKHANLPMNLNFRQHLIAKHWSRVVIPHVMLIINKRFINTAPLQT